MSLAIFDLDNTLLSGDSDYLWGQYLAEIGAVDDHHYEAENLRFYEQYKAGDLDIYEFLRFSLRPLADNEPQELRRWRSQFIATKIEPIVRPAALQLLQQHRDKGDEPLIITATNGFLTQPIADLFGVPHVLATVPEQRQGRFTGEVAGTPCFREGKITRLHQWLEEYPHDLEGSWFYSDSHNDIPLLELVTHAVAVDPDDALNIHARERGWPIISLGNGSQPPAPA